MVVLRDYQRAGSDWLQSRRKGILADDVGLGKTYQAIDALRAFPALIVAPSYLTQQWYTVLCQTVPASFSISLPEGTRNLRKSEIQRPADIRVVNMEMLRNYKQYMTGYQTVVLDEAHHYRNARTAQSEIAAKLVRDAEYAYLLTASPHYKELQDIWHLLYMIDSRYFGSYWTFMREWFSVNWGYPYAPKVYGLKASRLREWQVTLSRYMLRRTYADVGKQLPPLIEHIVRVPMPSALRSAYEQIRTKWKLAGAPLESAGAVMVLLRQLTMNHNKAQAVLNILQDCEQDEPVLIYTWYKDAANVIYNKIAAYARTIVLTGDTAPMVRAQALKPGKYKYIIATQASIGEGVNLQHIRYVIYTEESYVPEQHRQTLARVHRDRNATTDTDAATATEPVIAYYVRVARTIDETIPRVRNTRSATIAAVAEELAQ